MVGAAAGAVVAVAREASGVVEATSASPRSANTLQALPTAPEDRLSVCAMARGVRAVHALSARTFATIARSSPLRNRGTPPPAVAVVVPGAAGAVVGVVGVVI